MADADKGAKTWFKYGCFGCLGLIFFVLLVVGGFAGVAMLQVRSEQVEDRVLTRDVRGLPASQDAAEPPALPPDSAELVPVPPTPGGLSSGEAVGTVFLDLSGAEFEVMPGRPGEPMNIKAKYDKNAYELEEVYEGDAGSGWTYHVKFRRTASGFLQTLKQLFGGTHPHVSITLPVDTPMNLDFRLGQGGSRVDLGGLWLRHADLKFTQGGLEMEVSEPMPEPMERFTINGSMGGAAISRLGNASPRSLDVDFSMGGIMLDLRGEWAADAEISITHSMGGGAIRLPRNVAIQGLGEHDRSAPAGAELPPPTLVFRSSSSMGELEFIE